MSRLAKMTHTVRGSGVAIALATAGALAVLVAVPGCAAGPAPDAGPVHISSTATPFVLVTTSAVKDLGLGGTLVTAFQQAYPQYELTATVVAAPDPAAYVRTQGGDLVIMGDSPAGAALLKSGYGRRVLPVMSDHLVLVGPKDDPASVRTAPSLSVALARIADAGQSASSPGGVPVRFVGVAGDPVVARLWASAGRKPSGGWYSAVASGTAQQLKAAAETPAYAVVEEAAFRALGTAGTPLAILRSGKDMPSQRYVAIPLVGAHDPAIAEVFGDWLAKGGGQDLIAGWGSAGSAGPLFTPARASAVIWPSGQ